MNHILNLDFKQFLTQIIINLNVKYNKRATIYIYIYTTSHVRPNQTTRAHLLFIE